MEAGREAEDDDDTVLGVSKNRQSETISWFEKIYKNQNTEVRNLFVINF